MPTQNIKVFNKLRMSICYNLFLTCSPVTIVMDFRGKTVKNASIKGSCKQKVSPSMPRDMCDPNVGNTALAVCDHIQHDQVTYLSLMC